MGRNGAMAAHSCDARRLGRLRLLVPVRTSLGGWDQLAADPVVPDRSHAAAHAPSHLLLRRVRLLETPLAKGTRVSWRQRACLAGIAAAAVTFLLLAPFRCETHYMRFVPGDWDTESVTTSCQGVAAFHYRESRELVGSHEPKGGVLPQPFLFQPQAVITAAVLGSLVALIAWLMVERPRLGKLAKWTLSPVLLGISFLSAIDPGGLVIYATPALILLFWWMALQSGAVARAIWALIVASQ